MSNSTCTPAECANPGPRGGPCAECKRARDNPKQLAKYYANREARIAYNKQYRESDPARQKQRVADWFAAHKEERAAYLDLHRDERNAKTRARRAANPGEGVEYGRAWRKANPEKWALRNRENSRRRQTGTTHSRVSYAAVLERDGMVCHICGREIASLADLHFDHVIPLSKGGEHAAHNIKPAHALCNLRKSDKII